MYVYISSAVEYVLESGQYGQTALFVLVLTCKFFRKLELTNVEDKLIEQNLQF